MKRFITGRNNLAFSPNEVTGLYLGKKTWDLTPQEKYVITFVENDDQMVKIFVHTHYEHQNPQSGCLLEYEDAKEFEKDWKIVKGKI